jgi:hypothetical protein
MKKLTHTFSFLFSFILFVTAAVSVSAQNKNTELTSAEEIASLDRDFRIQGEYLYKDQDNTADNKGLAVIAEGLGKFRVVVYGGGLPGDGWFMSKGRTVHSAELTNFGELTVRDNTGSPVIYKITQNVLVDPNARSFTKVERKSPTLGQKAPVGAIVLFDDGKASDWFTKADVNEKSQTLWSEAQTKPFEQRPYTLHVEFMTSFMPFARGQGRSNSGVYINQSYECQILDSFGLDGKNNECGGFYQISEPKVNMCYPPLQWQTYDIDYTPATYDADGKRLTKTKISVKHNGVEIQKDVEFDKETFVAPKKEGPEPGGLYLQGHGNRVQYRNIWLKYND